MISCLTSRAHASAWAAALADVETNVDVTAHRPRSSIRGTDPDASRSYMTPLCRNPCHDTGFT